MDKLTVTVVSKNGTTTEVRDVPDGWFDPRPPEPPPPPDPLADLDALTLDHAFRLTLLELGVI